MMIEDSVAAATATRGPVMCRVAVASPLPVIVDGLATVVRAATQPPVSLHQRRAGSSAAHRTHVPTLSRRFRTRARSPRTALAATTNLPPAEALRRKGT